MEDILNTFLRSAFAFLVVFAVTRILGRKSVSQMTFFDFAVAISAGSITANIAVGSNANTVVSTTALATFCLLGFIFDVLHIRSFLLRKLIGSEPVILIRNGKIVKKNMEKTRLSINNLTALLREKSAFNVADVEFAILENDGKLSVLPKSQKQPLTPSDMNIPTPYKGLTKDLVIDGHIMEENLKDVKLGKEWLISELGKKGIDDVGEVFFAALDTSGNLYVSKGLEGREKHGKYGIE